MNEIWIADFEFNGVDAGDNPHPVCFCATELNSNKTVRMWLDGDKPPAPLDFRNPQIVYVAYYGVAEISCHLSLGWDIPENIVDLYCEWRMLSNGMADAYRKDSLIDVCRRFNIPTIDPQYKERMRTRILAGAPFSAAEREEILDYCGTDVTMTTALYKILYPQIDNWERARFRGRHMAITAEIERNGIPLDLKTLTLLRNNWEGIKLELVKEVSKEFNFFDGLTFKTKAFENYLIGVVPILVPKV